MKKFAAFFYGYFYFFGFSVEKVRVFFAANKRLPSVAYPHGIYSCILVYAFIVSYILCFVK